MHTTHHARFTGVTRLVSVVALALVVAPAFAGPLQATTGQDTGNQKNTGKPGPVLHQVSDATVATPYTAAQTPPPPPVKVDLTLGVTPADGSVAPGKQPPPPPVSPPSLGAFTLSASASSAVLHSSYTLSWSAPKLSNGTGSITYTPYWSETSGASGTLPATTSRSLSDSVDSSATTITYYILAKAAGVMKKSNAVSIKITAPPPSFVEPLVGWYGTNAFFCTNLACTSSVSAVGSGGMGPGTAAIRIAACEPAGIMYSIGMDGYWIAAKPSDFRLGPLISPTGMQTGPMALATCQQLFP